MPYLSQDKIKVYREKHKPSRCPILGMKTNDWVLDHDHDTGMVRGVLSRQANSLLGKVENFYFKMCKGQKEFLPDALEAMANFLRQRKSNVLHPVGLTQLTKRFSRSLTSAEQSAELSRIGASQQDIDLCSNQKDRAKLFRTLTKTKYE